MRLPKIHSVDRLLLGIFPVRHWKVDFHRGNNRSYASTLGALPGRLSTDARILYDILFQPLARRPLARLSNDLLGTRIKHNSIEDIVLHSFFVSGSVAICVASVGAAIGLSLVTIDIVSISLTFFIHCYEEDGLLRPLFI